MSAAKPAVSVIIPCYRAEAHLGRAVASLLAQTMSDWEAVIVSDDGVDYRDILKTAGITDRRLTFASTGGTATGPGNARNAGLDHASATIVAYLDADDMFAPDYLEKLVPLAHEHGFVQAGHVFIDEATKQPVPTVFTHLRKTGLVGLHHIAPVLFSNTNICVLYNRQRMPARWVPELRVCEDTLFMFQAYDYLDAVFIHPEPLYLYHRRLGSLTNSPETVDNFIRSKYLLLDKARDGTMFRNPDVARMAELYFRQSVEIEEEYAKTLRVDPNADFLAMLVQRMKERGLI